MSEEKNPLTDQGSNEAPRGTAANPLPEQTNTYAESYDGLGYDEDQVPDQQANSDQAQAQGLNHPAGQVPGQTASQGQGQEKFAQASGMEGYFGGNSEEEQEGQKVNVEQAHESNTAQYKGKPGVKAPSPGQEQGTAWSQDMELSNSDVPARNPNSY